MAMQHLCMYVCKLLLSKRKLLNIKYTAGMYIYFYLYIDTYIVTYIHKCICRWVSVYSKVLVFYFDLSRWFLNNIYIGNGLWTQRVFTYIHIIHNYLFLFKFLEFLIISFWFTAWSLSNLFTFLFLKLFKN